MNPNSHTAIRKALRLFRPPCLLPRRKRILWTFPYMVRPAYVRQKFGDGMRLLGIMPVMHRPCYYLAWVDSRHGINSDEFRESLHNVVDAIGDEFGFRSHEDNRPYRWPEADFSDGYSWFEADVHDVLPPRRLAVIKEKA